MRIGNWPLVMLALEHIIKHAEQYRQSTWRSDCGSFRCVAGWIAHFAGWRDVIEDDDTIHGFFLGVSRTGRETDGVVFEIEEAALMALELDPEIYGTEVGIDARSEYMDDLASALFGGYQSLPAILETVLDLMKADGVTPTPLIEAEMKSAGVLSDSETW